MTHQVFVNVSGITGSGKTAIFRLLESALKDCGVEVNFDGDDSRKIEEREAHKECIGLGVVKSIIAPNITVTMRETSLKREGVNSERIRI